MGTGYAGNDGSLELSDDDVSYNNIGGGNSITVSTTHETLDVTDFSDTAFARVMGLSDVSFSVSGNYDDTDAAQTTLETQFDAKNTVYIRFTSGSGSSIKAECYCTSLEVTSSPDGKEEFSAEFVGASGAGWTRA